MPHLFILFTTLFTTIFAEPLMLHKGAVILDKSFDKASDVDKDTVKFNKETQHKVQNGQLHATPPIIAYAGLNKSTKWAKSAFTRVNFTGLPQDYICQFRWQYKAPKDPKVAAKSKVYLDLGHRCLRLAFTAEGTTLLIENHLVDSDGKLKAAGKPTSIVLDSDPLVKLVADKWYDVVTEVKGDELVIQIAGKTFYGRHPMIKKERANSFHIDAYGDGYLLDSLKIWQSGAILDTWPGTRSTITN